MSFVRSDIGPYCITPLWVSQSVTPTALKVYAVLSAKYADRTTGEAFPRRKLLADECGISVDTLDRALKELESADALVVLQRKSESGSLTTNNYVIQTVRPGSRMDEATLAANLRLGMGTDAATSILPKINTPITLEPEPENEAAPAHPFCFLYSENYRRLNRRPAPHTDLANAMSIEREYGSEACIGVATDYAWGKSPNYYRPILEERRADAIGANSSESDAPENTDRVAQRVSGLDRRRAALAG